MEDTPLHPSPASIDLVPICGGGGSEPSLAAPCVAELDSLVGGTSTSRTTSGTFASTDVLLPADLAGQLVSLAEITYPFEACGLLIGQQIDRTVVVEQITYGRNLESTSFQGAAQRRGFRLDPEDFLAADVAARSADRDIVGVWHSHPDTPAQPTERDRKSAWAGYSYLIVSVSAVGSAELRSWRLTEDRFLEEQLR